MFMPGSTGTNKVLGQQSTSIETDKLIGNWIPGTGIVNNDSSTGWGADAPNYWQNQVSGGNHLRVLNCEANDMVTSAPKHIAPDGTNEYLGAASANYGGSPFQMVTERNWAISVWLKPPGSSPASATHGILSIGAVEDQPNLVIVSSGDPPGYTDQFGTDTYYQIKFSANGSAAATFYAIIPHDITNTPKWFNLTVIATGSQRDVSSGLYPPHKSNIVGLINGTVVWYSDDSNIFPSGSSGSLSIGASAFDNSSGGLNSFIGAGWLIGHIHVYAPPTSNSTDFPALTISKARQNYHAINETYKSITNHRHYGDTSYGKF